MNIYKLCPLLGVLFLLMNCNNSSTPIQESSLSAFEIIYTSKSQEENTYQGFDSPKAINAIAKMENQYFNNFERNRMSPYYGTVWRENAEKISYQNDTTIYQDYRINLQGEADSLHCTLYAYEALKAGLDATIFEELETHHKRIWKDREIAGWSVGYILIKYFNWKAYLFLDPNSHEYNHCIQAYQKNKVYPVWKQPQIPLEKMYIIGQDNSSITALLEQHEFSWGFSDQGYHTWITRFTDLKECNWAGAPTQKYNDVYAAPLFKKTSFLNYHDYQSHIIVVPPKK